ncbi:MAG: hypothetical protein WAU39_05885 [Polyangiales bacterium]
MSQSPFGALNAFGLFATGNRQGRVEVVLEFLADILVELVGSLIPPRFGMVFFALVFFAAAAVCFGFGAWFIYRAIVEETERALAALTLLAWAMAWALALLGWRLLNDHRQP